MNAKRCDVCKGYYMPEEVVKRKYTIIIKVTGEEPDLCDDCQQTINQFMGGETKFGLSPKTDDRFQEKKFLLQLIEENPKCRSGPLYEKYSKAGGQFSYKTFQRMVRELEMMGAVTTPKTGGSGGNTRIITIKEGLDTGEKAKPVWKITEQYWMNVVLEALKEKDGLCQSDIRKACKLKGMDCTDPTIGKIVRNLEGEGQVRVEHFGNRKSVYLPGKRPMPKQTPAEKATVELGGMFRLPDQTVKEGADMPPPPEFTYDAEKQEEQTVTRNPLAHITKPFIDKRKLRMRWVMPVANQMVGKGLSRAEAMKNAQAQFDDLSATEKKKIYGDE